MYPGFIDLASQAGVPAAARARAAGEIRVHERLLGGLVFGTVRNANDIATQAYQQQHQEQPASADTPKNH